MIRNQAGGKGAGRAVSGPSRVPGLGRAVTADWAVEGGHIAERVGLFVIICLGESVLVTGATFSGLTWTPEVVWAAVVAFLGTLAIWWLYFSASHDAAADRRRDNRHGGRR